MMKIACSSWSYHRAFQTHELDIHRWISICADELMLDGVELLDFHLEKPGIDYRELKDFISKKGLTIACLSVSNNFGYESEKKLRKEVAKVKKWIDTTALFGASIMRVFAGWAGPAPWDEDYGRGSSDRDVVWPRMIGCLRECVAYAEKAGLVLAVENHNHRGLVSTSEDAKRIVAEIDSSWFRLNLDTGGYTKDIYTAIEDTVDLAVHVHIKILQPGEEVIDKKLDYERIFGILKKKNYSGFISVEYEGEDDELTSIPGVIKRIKDEMS